MYVSPSQYPTAASIAQEISTSLKFRTGLIVPIGTILEHFRAEGTGATSLGGNGTGGYNLAGIMNPSGQLADYTTQQQFISEYVATAANDITGAQKKGLVGTSGVLTPNGYALALQKGGTAPYCQSQCGSFYTGGAGTGKYQGGSSKGGGSTTPASVGSNFNTGSPLANTLLSAAGTKPSILSWIANPSGTISYTMTELFGVLIGLVLIAAGVWAMTSGGTAAKAIRGAIGGALGGGGNNA